jgi:hypothetical protein
LLRDSIPNIGKRSAGKGITQKLGEFFFCINPFRKEQADFVMVVRHNDRAAVGVVS